MLISIPVQCKSKLNLPAYALSMAKFEYPCLTKSMNEQNI